MPRKVVTLHRWQLVGIFVLVVLSAVLAVMLVNHEAHVRTNENRKLILAQGRVLREQTHQRAEITYTTCLDQNDRHDKTIMRVDTLLAKARARNTVTKEQVRQARASYVFIIEALAPHQNCKQLVLDRFGFVPDVKGD